LVDGNGASAMKPTLATLVYCVEGSRVLLLERNKPPFVGYCVGPGGKLEALESPSECAVRELREETGLIADHVVLRGIVREVSPRPDWQWLLFIYVVDAWTGTQVEHCPEGVLAWWQIDALPVDRMPDADREFLPRILDCTAPVYEARCEYSDEIKLRDIAVTNPRKTRI
jgi:8-oxo-dGTP diphosphatase